MKVKTQEIKKVVLKSLKQKKEEEKETLKVEEENEESDDESNESLDSDQELQLAFAKKRLLPGLNIQVEPAKEFVNDEPSLKRKLDQLYLHMDWMERMDVTIAKRSINLSDLQTGNSNSDSVQLKDLTDNDFKRESLFLRQAEMAVAQALPKLNASKVQFTRPEDYFAQMAKSDDHMKRVRESLLSKHAEMEKREKVRKLREMKKMGKSIQQEAEKKKLHAKKSLNTAVKKYKKGDKDSLEIELEGSARDSKKKPVKRKIKMNEPPGRNGKQDDEQEPRRSSSKWDDGTKNSSKFGLKPSKKANFKENKYGFGGRKKRSKYNTAESYAEGYQKSGGNKKFGGNIKGGNKKTFTKKDKKFTNKNKPKSRT